jgi:hypothetical protein
MAERKARNESVVRLCQHLGRDRIRSLVELLQAGVDLDEVLALLRKSGEAEEATDDKSRRVNLAGGVQEGVPMAALE